MTSPMFTARPERLADVLPEFIALLNVTHDEFVTGPGGATFVPALDVNASAYLTAEAAGLVSFVTLRDPSGTMVGAAASLVVPHLHTGIVTATTDALHILPEACELGGAVVLHEGVKADVVARGAVRWMMGERFDAARPVNLTKHGFTPVGAYHALWVGEAAPC